MKIKNNELYLGLTAVCGLIAAGLRVMMLRTGIDEKGLLVRGNPFSIALWVLTIAVLALLVFAAKKAGSGGKFRDNFPACRLRFALSALGGVLMLLCAVGQMMDKQLLAGVFALLAGAAMIFTGFCRLKGRHPSPMFHTLVCVFFIIRLILSFQGWSADPQFQDYAVQMLSLVCLMLFAFHRASCDANLIGRGRTAFFGLAAVYFCLASLSDETMPLLYAAGALWSAGAGVNLDPLPTEKQE